MKIKEKAFFFLTAVLSSEWMDGYLHSVVGRLDLLLKLVHLNQDAPVGNANFLKSDEDGIQGIVASVLSAEQGSSRQVRVSAATNRDWK